MDILILPSQKSENNIQKRKPKQDQKTANKVI